MDKSPASSAMKTGSKATLTVAFPLQPTVYSLESIL